MSVCLTEPEAPFTDCFKGYNYTTHPHDFFRVAIAESEAGAEQHRVADDLGGEMMAAVEGAKVLISGV